MQRILIVLTILFYTALVAKPFMGYISLAVIDTFISHTEKFLIMSNSEFYSKTRKFFFKVYSIEQDEEDADIAWITMTIYYKQNVHDDYQCIQQGRVNTKQIYYFSDPRYLLGFFILPSIK